MASTLHNRKDVTSVRVEGFPSPDAKTMMEAMDGVEFLDKQHVIIQLVIMKVVLIVIRMGFQMIVVFTQIVLVNVMVVYLVIIILMIVIFVEEIIIM